jgi:hypothetical protein
VKGNRYTISSDQEESSVEEFCLNRVWVLIAFNFSFIFCTVPAVIQVIFGDEIFKPMMSGIDVPSIVYLLAFWKTLIDPLTFICFQKDIRDKFLNIFFCRCGRTKSLKDKTDFV